MSLPVASGGLPAEARQQLKFLAQQLDHLVLLGDNMLDASNDLAERVNETTLKHAKHALKAYTGSNARAALLNGSLEQAEKIILASVPEWWDASGNVTVTAIAKVVGLFISSFPQHQPNAEIFTVQMIEDVQDWNPHPFPLSEACRELRLTMKFTPSIAELCKAYDEASYQWGMRWDWKDDVDKIAKELTALIDESEKQHERDRLEREREELEREREQRERHERQKAATRRAELELDSCQDRFAALHQAVEALGLYGSLALGRKHHETCAIHDDKLCDCIPAIWGTVAGDGDEPPKTFWIDEHEAVTETESTYAEAKARARGKPR
ncbi:hypothetical protein [Bradyrhizobium sp. USDA 4508]